MIPIDQDPGRIGGSHVGTPEPDHGVEDEVIHMLRSHGEREGSLLSSYQRLAEQSDDEGLRYLVRLIMQDEARHHQQISEMLNNLHSSVWELDIEPKVPNMRLRHDPGLREGTGRLLAFEKEDAKELRRLRSTLRGSKRHPLLPLLVSLMLHDTAKHIDILRFIRSWERRR